MLLSGATPWERLSQDAKAGKPLTPGSPPLNAPPAAQGWCPRAVLVYGIPTGMYLVQQGFLLGMAIILYSLIPLCRGVGFCHAGNKGFVPGFISECCVA